MRIAGSLAAVVLLLGAAFVTGVQARNAGHAAGASPTYGGSIVDRTTNPADCLDPDKTASATADQFDILILDPLLSISPTGKITGDLATKYKVVNKAGTKIDFFLRQGVKFSNGDPFTATDVKYSFDRAINPATKSPVTASQLAALKSTKVINKYEVELTLSTPFRPLLTNLSSAYTGILDHKVGGNCTSQIGTGIYKVVSTGTAFDDVTFTANKYHNFGPSWVLNKGVPWITHLEFKNITSDATAISELLAGGVDLTNVLGTQLSRVQGNKSFTLPRLPAQNCTFVEFNTSHPPFNNVAVRRAFAEIIDRKNIVKAALNGLGLPVYGPIPPAIPYYDKNVVNVMPKFNVSKATQAIQAQHAAGPYNFLSFNTPDIQTASEIIQSDAAQAGMKLNIDTKASVGDFIAQANKGSFDAMIIGYGYNDPDVMYLLLHSSQGNGKGLNWTFDNNNPQLDKLLTEGRTTLAKKKVVTIMNQTQELIDKQAEMLGVYATVPIEAVRKTIHGFRTNPEGIIDFQDLYVKTK
jgi:peptide/nickel transport system substrate-binding protein